MNNANRDLVLFRIRLREHPAEKFGTVMDCHAIDPPHAMEQAKLVYPASEIISCLPAQNDQLAVYVIYSPSMDAEKSGAAFWSNTLGWTSFAFAEVFREEDRRKARLPITRDASARWIRQGEAAEAYGDSRDLPMESWLRNLPVGAEVWWNDPEHGRASGIYTLCGINEECGAITRHDTVLHLCNQTGSAVEAYAHEITQDQPEDLYPVVDGENGKGDVLGAARCSADAIAVANSLLLDEVACDFGGATLTENVRINDGTVIPIAWIATANAKEQGRLRGTIDARYTLNGESLEDMADRLRNGLERTISEGLLTGDSSATVNAYTVDVHVIAVPGVPSADLNQLATTGRVFGDTNIERIGSVMMSDVIGHYDAPEEVPEWLWIAQNATFAHVRNGQGGGIWEFVLNLSHKWGSIPVRLAPVIANAKKEDLSYLIFHQGT